MSNQSTRPHMLSQQDRLPRLPIPPLKRTIDRYLESIVPIAGDDAVALSDTHTKAGKFLHVADRLQERLVAYEKTEPNSWLEKWWLEMAYMSWREGLCINSSYWLAFADDPHAYEVVSAPSMLLPNTPEYNAGTVLDSKEYSDFQVRRAAKFIQKAIDYKELIDAGRLPIDRTRAGPLCMHQYNLIFGMTRIPRMGCDELRQDKVTVGSCTIIVVVEDQLYSVKVYDDAGHRKQDGDLEAELNAVVADLQERRQSGDLDPPVTVLTAGHRDRWATAYEILEKDPFSLATLKAIQESLLVVSLDTTYSEPYGSINAHQISMKCHGTQPGHNRWYDKCVNFIFDRNGSAGYVGEHSPCDALIPAFMMEYIAKAAAPEPIKQDIRSTKTRGYQAQAHRLRFVNVGTKVLQLIEEADKELAQTAADSCSRQIRFENYGSDWIKKAAKISPDSFAQLALQLTYYRLHGECAPVYETSSTRQYLHGRTETVRSLTSEAVDFVTTMSDRSANSLDKYEALVRAASRHQVLLREASAGQGVDRHLMGLKLAYHRLQPLPNEVPLNDEDKQAIEDFFNDPIMAKSTTFQLSTSGLFPSYYLTHTGFGTIFPQPAYGINYIIESRRIKLGTEGKKAKTEKGTNVEMFESTLRQSLLELKIICEQSNNIPLGDSSRL